jgi:hypothetical protein
VSNLFSTSSKTPDSKKFNEAKKNVNTISDSTDSIDSLYFKNANNLYNYAKTNKRLNQLDDAINALNLFSIKFPNSIYISEVKSKNKELLALRKDFSIRDSIINKIAELNNLYQFKNSLSVLSKSKHLFSDEEFLKLKNEIISEREKPIKLSIVELLSNSKFYDGKIVELDDLRPISNDIKNKYFTAYKSTGSGSLDFDTDLRIQIRYEDAINRNDLVYLTGDNRPNISVIGKFVDISFFGSYIDAKEINY